MMYLIIFGSAVFDCLIIRRPQMVAHNARIAALSTLVSPLRRPGCASVRPIYVVLIDFAAVGISLRRVLETPGVQTGGTQVHDIFLHLPTLSPTTLLGAGLTQLHGYFQRYLSSTLFPMAADDVDRVVGGALVSRFRSSHSYD